jgi:hypothetical protein
MRHRFAVALAGAAMLASITVAGTASAAPYSLTGETAITQLTARPDSGGNGNWADDSISRYLNIQLIGRDPNPARGWDYYATVRDLGTFRTLAGAYTPNQGAPYTGHHIVQITTGRIAGQGAYEFTATSLPQMSLVPSAEPGAPATTAETTSDWYMQAFPAGTVFGGPGLLNTWEWDYTGPSCGPFGTQNWLDAAFNSGGQNFTAGNITGICF